jgi:hypothetical protein
LRDYHPLTAPIERGKFFNDPSARAELLAALKQHDGLFYTKDLDLNQGAYLTEAPTELLSVFNRIYQTKTGATLPGFSTNKISASPKVNLVRLGAAVHFFYWIFGESGFDEERYKSEERGYKVALSDAWRAIATKERFEAALNGTADVESFAKELGDLLSDQRRHNLLPWRYADVLKGPWDRPRAEIFVRATHKLLFDGDRAAPAIDDFNANMLPFYRSKLTETSVKPASHCIPSLMLWLSEPARQFFLRPGLYNLASSVVCGTRAEGQGEVMTALYYAEAVEFVAALADALKGLGLHPIDMIDVQGFVWAIFSHSKVWFGGKSYGGTRDMLPEFVRRKVYATGFAKIPEVAKQFEALSKQGKEERDQRLSVLESTLKEKSELSAITAFFELAYSPGSLLLAKSVYFNAAKKQSIIRISAAAITRDGYQFDSEIGHQIPVEWRTQPTYEAILPAPLFPKLNGTLASLPLGDALDAIASAVPLRDATPDIQTSPVLPAEPASSPRLQPIYALDDFIEESRLSGDSIKQWQKSLLRKGQVILQGPPGTGKTFVAERLARLLVSGTSGHWEIVQFHPSYAYEDFMQGIRPSIKAGALSYNIEPGRFLEFCERASNTNGAPAVIIIDEINRANLSRVFGELMYLLEYRDREVPLSTGAKPFQIPKNVYLIGTMNTADRSIALVDHALRRRFSFIYLEPNYDVLKSHLVEDGLPADSLINTLRTLNAAIDDRHCLVGISFFLTDGTKLRSTLEDIWRGEIEPYLDEYFYDQPDKAKAFRWDTLVAKELAAWA